MLPGVYHGWYIALSLTQGDGYAPVISDRGFRTAMPGIGLLTLTSPSEGSRGKANFPMR